MTKLDPKLTAPKVVPIDRVREAYDEPDEPVWPGPEYGHRDMLIDACLVIIIGIVATLLFRIVTY